jgi:hypothetical protein
MVEDPLRTLGVKLLVQNGAEKRERH